jgi:ABC-type antimicrobial peptide transport system permease subunit
MALGATRQGVLRLVLGHAILLIATGVALGLAASLALSSIMRSLLFQVSERDPSTFLAIAVTLAVVGLAASILPARRATRVDPLVALRAE